MYLKNEKLAEFQDEIFDLMGADNVRGEAYVRNLGLTVMLVWIPPHHQQRLRAMTTDFFHALKSTTYHEAVVISRHGADGRSVVKEVVLPHSYRNSEATFDAMVELLETLHPGLVKIGTRR